jgi:metallo-beta-lactamase class B
MQSIFASIIALALASIAAAQQGLPSNPDWTRPFPPFRMIGNIYWVGSYDLATYLITTPQGHILINTGVGDTANQIKASVEQLKFSLADVKYISATHGHFDHVAGVAALKKMTGATVVVMEQEAPLLETGGKADFRFGEMPGARFDPVKVDRTLKNGDTIGIGGTVLTAHHHPGPTRGATTFTLNVQEGGRTFRVAIANMGTINPGVVLSGKPSYPTIAEDYARTFREQKAMQIDVWLASHAGQFNMHSKYKPGDAYRADRFVDPKGFLAAVDRLEKAYLDQLVREKKAR